MEVLISWEDRGEVCFSFHLLDVKAEVRKPFCPSKNLFIWNLLGLLSEYFWKCKHVN